MSIKVLCPFIDWAVGFLLLLSCMSCLYILEIKRFSVVSFASISVGCLFVFFLFFFKMVSFSVQKLVSLIMFNLFIYVCIPVPLGD